MEDDVRAVRRLKSGDIGGLEMLVCRYQVKAIRAAFMILRDRQAAEDVAQDTFLRIFRSIHRFDESRPFGPYLLRSVVNTALDQAQKDTNLEQVGDLEPLEELLQSPLSVEGASEQNAIKDEIHKAIEQLSPRQRAAVVMRYYLEMSEKEMAEAMNVRPGTVKRQLHAARERLRALLGANRRIL